MKAQAPRWRRALAAATLLSLSGWVVPPARAVDAVVESAATALATLTSPQRLETLPEDVFRAQLGPALGWLHVRPAARTWPPKP